MASLELQAGVKVLTPKPLDEYYGPYTSVANAVAAIPQAVRYDGLTVKIIGVGEYWWLSGNFTDTGLVQKGGGGGGDVYPGFAEVDLSTAHFRSPTGDLFMSAGGSEVFFYGSIGGISWGILNGNIDIRTINNINGNWSISDEGFFSGASQFSIQSYFSEYSATSNSSTNARYANESIYSILSTDSIRLSYNTGENAIYLDNKKLIYQDEVRMVEIFDFENFTTLNAKKIQFENGTIGFYDLEENTIYGKVPENNSVRERMSLAFGAEIIGYELDVNNDIVSTATTINLAKMIRVDAEENHFCEYLTIPHVIAPVPDENRTDYIFFVDIQGLKVKGPSGTVTLIANY